MFRSRAEFLAKADQGPGQQDAIRLPSSTSPGSGGSTGAKTIPISIVGLPGHDTALPLLRWSLRHTFTFDAASAVANSDVASSGTAVFSLRSNGVQQGTVTFTSGTTGVVAFTNAVFPAGTIFELYPPASADVTLDEVSITLPVTVS